MASTYDLLCFDCGRYRSLGKVYWRDDKGAPLSDIRTQGVYDPSTKQWHSRDDVFSRALEGMLIRHRNHELRFVPEGLDEMLETVTGRSIEPLELRDIVSPQGEVDPEEELATWRTRLKIG